MDRPGPRINFRGLPPALRPQWFLSIGVLATFAVASLGVPLPPAQLPEPAFEQPSILEMFTPPRGPHRHLYFEEVGISETGITALVRAGAPVTVRVRLQDLGNEKTEVVDEFTLRSGESRQVHFQPENSDALMALTWRNQHGQMSSIALRADQMPYPLPSVTGPYCTLALTSMTWAPGLIEGTLAATCVDEKLDTFEVAVEAGYLGEASLPARRPAFPTTLAGMVHVRVPETDHLSAVSLDAEGHAAFSVPLPDREGFHQVVIETGLDVGLIVDAPSYVETFYFPPYEEEYHR